MRFPSSSLAVGDRVWLRGAYLDEACTLPVVGTVGDMFARPDWGGAIAHVVMFEHDVPGLPPGGAFTADRLAPYIDPSTIPIQLELGAEPDNEEADRGPAA